MSSARTADSGSSDGSPDGSIPDVSPEIPSAHWRGILRLLAVLPQGAMSRGFGHIADAALPRSLRRPVLGAFARAMRINATEAEKPLDEYASINDFFVRRLVDGARTIDARQGHIVSPVDGIIGQAGTITEGTLVQAKGRFYTAAALLDDENNAREFEGGTFITIYLSPRHYHRIHSPADGRITSATHLPGALLPVNAPSVQHIDALFPRNERLVCNMSSDSGAIAVVAVGAYNVGRISAAFDHGWRNGASITNRPGAARDHRVYDPPLTTARGAEIMAFHLGSTVVMLFERRIALDPVVAPGREVVMGSSLGVARPTDA